MTVSDLTASEIKKKMISFAHDLDTKYKDKGKFRNKVPHSVYLLDPKKPNH